LCVNLIIFRYLYILKKQQLKYKILLLFSFVIFVTSCIDPYDLKYNLDNSVLIIDGVITDTPGEQTIIIKESIPNGDGNSSTVFGLEKALVEIEVNGTEKVLFTESKTTKGNYDGPKNFKADLNKTYRLLVTTAQGKKYQSSLEKIKPGNEIKKVYQQFEVVGKPIDKNFKASHKIYLDTDDPPAKGNNYQWKWRLFEAQDICRTCEKQERYYPNPYPGRCIKDLPNFARETIYDYQCNGKCWEIIHSLDQNILNDEFSNGKTITGRLVADIPLYQFNTGALIEISQQSIDDRAYKYMKILIDQYQNTGGLADTPPVSLIGNISALDGSKTPVAGYFKVVDESIFRYWIDRSDIGNAELKVVGLLGGREKKPEPAGVDTTRPPLAPCINSYTRTNIQPEGWK
jgi:hypothetical protein